MQCIDSRLTQKQETEKLITSQITNHQSNEIINRKLHHTLAY